MGDVEPPRDDLELVEDGRGLFDTCFVLGRHDHGGGFGGYHRIQRLIDAGDAVEMGVKQGCDRGGAFDQGAGGPINGKKDRDIVEHAGPLSGWGISQQLCASARGTF